MNEKNEHEKSVQSETLIEWDRTTSSGSAKSNMDIMIAVVIRLLLSIAVSAASIYIYDQYFAQKVVMIDILGYVDQQKQLYLSGKISEEEWRAIPDDIDRAMNKEIKAHKNTVILIKDAVIRNARKIEIKN